MAGKSVDNTSPLVVTLLHLVPSVVLIITVVVYVSSLNLSKQKKVLGAESSLPKSFIETVDKRLMILNELSISTKSDSIVKEIEKLRK